MVTGNRMWMEEDENDREGGSRNGDGDSVMWEWTVMKVDVYKDDKVVLPIVNVLLRIVVVVMVV